MGVRLKKGREEGLNRGRMSRICCIEEASREVCFKKYWESSFNCDHISAHRHTVGYQVSLTVARLNKAFLTAGETEDGTNLGPKTLGCEGSFIMTYVASSTAF
jgi:hypothetical protein